MNVVSALDISLHRVAPVTGFVGGDAQLSPARPMGHSMEPVLSTMK